MSMLAERMYISATVLQRICIFFIEVQQDVFICLGLSQICPLTVIKFLVKTFILRSFRQASISFTGSSLIARVLSLFTFASLPAVKFGSVQVY